MEFLFENLNFIHWLILGIALIIPHKYDKVNL
jgi:hypothetical protein